MLNSKYVYIDCPPKGVYFKGSNAQVYRLISEILQPQTFVSDIDLYIFFGAFIQWELSTETENVIIP